MYTSKCFPQFFFHLYIIISCKHLISNTGTWSQKIVFSFISNTWKILFEQAAQIVFELSPLWLFSQPSIFLIALVMYFKDRKKSWYAPQIERGHQAE